MDSFWEGLIPKTTPKNRPPCPQMPTIPKNRPQRPQIPIIPQNRPPFFKIGHHVPWPSVNHWCWAIVIEELGRGFSLGCILSTLQGNGFVHLHSSFFCLAACRPWGEERRLTSTIRQSTGDSQNTTSEVLSMSHGHDFRTYSLSNRRHLATFWSWMGISVSDNSSTMAICMCDCVCMYGCLYLNIYKTLYACMEICAYVCKFVLSVRMSICMYASMYVCVYVCVNICVYI